MYPVSNSGQPAVNGKADGKRKINSDIKKLQKLKPWQPSSPRFQKAKKISDTLDALHKGWGVPKEKFPSGRPDRLAPNPKLNESNGNKNGKSGSKGMTLPPATLLRRGFTPQTPMLQIPEEQHKTVNSSFFS